MTALKNPALVLGFFMDKYLFQRELYGGLVFRVCKTSAERMTRLGFLLFSLISLVPTPKGMA